MHPFSGEIGTRIGRPDHPVRVVGSRSDKRPRHADSIEILASAIQVSEHGAASCRCATPPRPTYRSVPAHAAGPSKSSSLRQQSGPPTRRFLDFPARNHLSASVHTQQVIAASRSFRCLSGFPADNQRMKSSIRFGLVLSAVGCWLSGCLAPRQSRQWRLRAAQRAKMRCHRGARQTTARNVASQAERDALGQQPATAGPLDYDPELIKPLVDEARARGNSRRGAMLFGSPHFACISCHRVGLQGGGTGPELTNIGKTQTPEQIVESLLWPKRLVKPEFSVHLGRFHRQRRQTASAL